MLEESDIARIADALKLRLKAEGYVLIQAKEVKQLPAVMSKKRAAEELQVHPNTITKMIKRGELKQDRQKRIPASEIRRMLAI